MTEPTVIANNDREVQEIIKQVDEIAEELYSKVPVPFVSRKVHVFRAGGGRVCTAVSKTMARRISNALNQYIPGDRGY